MDGEDGADHLCSLLWVFPPKSKAQASKLLYEASVPASKESRMETAQDGRRPGF